MVLLLLALVVWLLLVVLLLLVGAGVIAWLLETRRVGGKGCC